MNKFTSKNYWILLNIAECYWILLDVTEYSTQRITEYSVTESFTDSTDSQWIYKKNIRLLRFNRPPDDITYIDNSNLSDSYYVEWSSVKCIIHYYQRLIWNLSVRTCYTCKSSAKIHIFNKILLWQQIHYLQTLDTIFMRMQVTLCSNATKRETNHGYQIHEVTTLKIQISLQIQS